MSKITSNLQCPACSEALQPKVLECVSCDLRVEGPFRLNEFATLPPEDLHFLRIFVRCEGRVRDMEPALGLSYPTIRSRLSDLKAKLMESAEERTEAPGTTRESASDDEVLDLLRQGKLTFDEAMAHLRKKEKT